MCFLFRDDPACCPDALSCCRAPFFPQKKRAGSSPARLSGSALVCLFSFWFLPLPAVLPSSQGISSENTRSSTPQVTKLSVWPVP